MDAISAAPAPEGLAGTMLAGPMPDPGWPDAPFPHGPFLVAPDGALMVAEPDEAPTARGGPELRFAWRGRDCRARIAAGQVRLSACAGALPYTAERRGDRPAALAAIGALPAELPGGWRLRVTPDHRLRIEAVRPLPVPTSAAALVGAMVGFALELDRYLDRLESAGVAPGT